MMPVAAAKHGDAASEGGGVAAAPPLHLFATLAIVFVFSNAAAFAEPEDFPAASSGDQTTLFVVPDETCNEDYAAELRSVGIPVTVRSTKTLETLGRFVEVPNSQSLTHLFVVGGYVVANHVAPIVVANLLAQQPKITGLIGPMTCPTSENHQLIHAEIPSSF